MSNPDLAWLEEYNSRPSSELQKQWQLYRGQDGVDAGEALEKSYTQALEAHKGKPVREAAQAIWVDVNQTMKVHRSAGARDIEPQWVLADRIAADLSRIHGINFEFSRWDGGFVS